MILFPFSLVPEFIKVRLAKSNRHCSESSLKQAMANLLCEERAKVLIRTEETDQESQKIEESEDIKTSKD